MMVTRRNLFSILLMMGVLFVLIQFFLVMKEQENDFTENVFYQEDFWGAENVFTPTVVASNEDTPTRDYVVYIGSKDVDVYPVIFTWCTYRKMDLMTEEKPRNYRRDLAHYPEAIIINGEELDFKRDLATIQLWENGNVPLIFATLPNVKMVQKNKKFMSLIGVDYMMKDDSVKEELVGYHVLGGFLLGGEVFYEPSNEEEKKRMDLNLNIPRYHVFNNTKSYIIGMYKKTPDDTELQPSLLWRYKSKGTNVFVVNGDFLRKMSGIGYLSAIFSEIRTEDVYPVVNAQAFSLLDFPGLSNENTDRMMEVYNRDQVNFYKDLVWPGIVTLVEDSGHVPTCYMAPKMNYEDAKSSPMVSELYYYLKQINERRGEMGISMNLLFDSGLKQKIAEDRAFMESADLSYRFGALYVPDKGLDAVTKEIASAEEGSYLRAAKTVIADGKDEPVKYLSDHVTKQNITGNLDPYYFSEDMENMGYETALAYANPAFEMSSLIWSVHDKDEWQKVSKTVAANLATYWKKYSIFDHVTATEADRRIRNFLALDFSWFREKDQISISIGGFNKEAWFMVRLSENQIKKIEGGTYEKMENGVYLIHANREQVRLQMGKKENSQVLIR